MVDTIVDIPIVLPPLVLGLSLLILFHLPIGGWELEACLRDRVGFPVTYRWPAVVLAQFSVACALPSERCESPLIRSIREPKTSPELWAALAGKHSCRFRFRKRVEE